MTETALSAALEGAGVNRSENEFLGAIAKYLNNGGTIARAEKLLALAAKRMPGGGQGRVADKGHRKCANAGHTNGGGTGHVLAAEGQLGSARPSSPNRGAGASLGEPKGHVTVSPSREPSAADIKAAATARRASAKAVLDLGWIGQAAMPAGPAYRNIRVGELETFRRRQVREGVNHGRSALVLARLHTEVEKLGIADQQAKVLDILPPETIKRISRETEMEVIGPMASGWLEGFIKHGELTVAGS